MADTAIFESLAAVFALAAAVFLLDQQVHRPRPYKLLWALGLLFYGVAAGAAAAGSLGGWSVAEYKLWYYFGGVLTAAYLGLGSLYLLGPRRVAHGALLLAAIVSVYAGLRILLLPVPAATVARLASSTTQQVVDVAHFRIFPDDIRATAILMNIPGALLLFGGAAWSGWSFWRRRSPGYRVLSMALLALGAVFPSVLTGSQALGYTAGAALGEFLGALCLFGGLLISLDVFTVFRVPFTRIVLHERQARAG